MHEEADKFEELNAELIFVFREEQDSVDGLKMIQEKRDTEFTLALDLDKKSSKSYSPEKMTFLNYVIDKKGVVRAEIDGTLKKRATAELLIEKLEEIEAEK